MAQLPETKEGEEKPQQPQNDTVYAMQGHYQGDYKGYLSYHTESGWCRQIYDKAADSQFKFVVHDIDLNQWNILNAYQDKRKDHWLSYGKCKERNGESVGLYKKQGDAAIWTLIPTDKPMYFKIKCYYQGSFKGWLSYQDNGKWNKLYENESDASVYFLKK